MYEERVVDPRTGGREQRTLELPANDNPRDIKGVIIGYFKRRREPRVGPRTGTFNELNVRPIEPIAAQDAPDPVRQGDTPARPARMPKAIFTTIHYNHSISQQDFGYPLFAAQKIAHYLYGSPVGQEPWRERANIETPHTVPYGSQYEIPSSPAPVGVEDHYAKLAG